MLTQARLKELLHYDKSTGVFTWLKSNTNSVRVGDTAGSNANGRAVISVDGAKYYSSRLTFLYVEGYFPEFFIDHIDGNPLNNKWVNLRHVSRVCNNQNTKKREDNTSGITGVYWNDRDQKWNARIYIQYVKIHLGTYKTRVDEALARYTFEQQCYKWNCDARGKIILSIKEMWPEFNPQGVRP